MKRLRLSTRRGPGYVVMVATCVLLVLLCWNTPLVLPLKWLVVFFHELSHAMMAWATGGRVHALNITHQQSGMCVVSGGNRTLILLAGYPGSLGWGLAAVFIARTQRYARRALMALGAILLLVGLGWVRPLLSFGFLLVLLLGALFGYAGWRGPAALARFVLVLVGATSCAYALVDIQQDVFSGHTAVSDAMLLAEHTMVPFWFWGLFWYAASLGVLVLAGRRLWRGR